MELSKIDHTVFEKEFEKLEKFGATYFLNHDLGYKCIVHGPKDQIAIERIFKGDKEIIVGYNSIPFKNKDISIHWAYNDALEKLDI